MLSKAANQRSRFRKTLSVCTVSLALLLMPGLGGPGRLKAYDYAGAGALAKRSHTGSGRHRI
jgi:hypothetical protein